MALKWNNSSDNYFTLISTTSQLILNLHLLPQLFSNYYNYTEFFWSRMVEQNLNIRLDFLYFTSKRLLKTEIVKSYKKVGFLKEPAQNFRSGCWCEAGEGEGLRSGRLTRPISYLDFGNPVLFCWDCTHDAKGLSRSQQNYED